MNTTTNERWRGRAWLATAAVGGVLTSLLPMAGANAAVPISPTTLHAPPAVGHGLGAFPARDFVSAEGLTPGDTVVFEVTHSPERGGGTTASEPIEVTADGTAEVNHTAPDCWAEVTPNIVAGDTVRVIVTGPAANPRIGQADQITVADVTAGRPSNPAPGTIIVKGHARSSTGAQLDLSQLEGRLVAPGATFQKTGRRDMRAPGTRGATLTYDEPGSTTNFGYTATWTGLTDADVQLALGAEAMIARLVDHAPVAGSETTVYESGAGIVNGPAAGCTAPKEKLPPLPGEDAEAPTTPGQPTATVSDLNTVTVNWPAAQDNTGVTDYGIYRNGVPVFTVQNADGTSPAPTTFVDRNVPPGQYTYTVDAGDAIGNRSPESLAVTATADARPAPAVPVQNPPTHPFTIFPSRDMIEVDGLAPGQQGRVEVIRNGRVVTDSTGLIPDDAGAVEINHVGAYCWAGTTPDLRANDAVRATAYNQDGSVAWVEEAVVANVTAQKAVVENGVLTVHGIAAGHDGKPLPIDQLEQRMVSSSAQPFAVNGRRTLRADAGGVADGTLSYDPISADNPVGIKWTARYPGLSAADQTLAQDVESRIMWLGRDPLAGLELTIFEVGLADPPGPAGPDCVAPLEPIDVQAPSAPVVAATAVGPEREVDLSWTPSSDNAYVYGYRIFQDGRQIAAVGGGESTFTATNVAPGDHTFAVEAYDSASPHGIGADDAARITAGLGQPYGNTSARSADAPVTMPDVQAPGVPKNLTVTNPTRTVTNPDGTTTQSSTNTARLVFDPSTDDSGVAPTYRVYRDGVLLPNAVPTLNANGKMVYTDTRLTQGTTYRYAVDAIDTAGNASARSTEVPVTIALDLENPVFTGNVVATVPDIHGKDVVLTWGAATDNIGVTGYGIYRDGVKIAQVDGGTLTYRDAGLAAGTYRYKVDAVDSAGNRSDRTLQTAQTAAIANDPPANGHSVLAFPARDFVEGDGYAGAGPVVVEVFRDGKVVGQARVTPTAAGLVEVNHAGPGCWGTAAFTNTPDIRAGDVVRITPVGSGIPDQTTVSDVYVGRPIQTAADTVVVQGTARDAAGQPLPLGELEARIIAGTSFRNGTKKLLAPGDGALAYDAPGSSEFTATFTGLTAADVTRALNGEVVINWLGRSPIVGNELTIFENGPGTDGGPAAGGCTAPLDPTAPLVSLTPANRVAFADQSAVPATTSAPRPVTLSNSGTSPVSLQKVYLGGANPADFAISIATADGTLPTTLAPGASVRVNVTFSPKAVGARSATLNFASNAANTSFQTVDLTGNGIDGLAPSAVTGLRRTLVNNSTVVSGAVPVTVSWNASTGATRYEVQKSVGSGTFADLPAGEQPGAATSIRQMVATGSATRYQVRACDGTHCSAYTPMAAFTLAAFQENNTSVISFRQPWTRSALTGSFGGSVSSTSTASNGATLKTNGTGFQIVTTTGPNRGRADVYVDGVRRTTLDLYSAAVSPARVMYTIEGLANATHSVELRALGTRNASSTGTRVDIDAFIALR